jgi:hypothetical protein
LCPILINNCSQVYLHKLRREKTMTHVEKNEANFMLVSSGLIA